MRRTELNYTGSCPVRRAAAWAGCVLAAAVLTAGCGGQGSNQPVIAQAGLVGTWASHEAGSLTFRPGNRFTATDLNLDGDFGVSCRATASVSGTWEFESPGGHTGISLSKYRTGNVISMNKEHSSDNSPSSCSTKNQLIDLTTWQINGPLGLCTMHDPDSPCDGEPFVWRKEK